MDIETHKILFSVKHPNRVLTSLQAILQQVLNRPEMRAFRGTSSSSEVPEVFIIDTDDERAQYIVNLLDLIRYRPYVAKTIADALTLLTSENCTPIAVILGQDGSSNPFFLPHLLQQITQKYGWKPPLIRLLSETTKPLQPISDASTLTGLSSVLPYQGNRVKNDREPDFKEIELKTIDAQRISLVGADIGRYSIHTHVGRGPLGDVYLAYDRLRGQNIVLKAIQTNSIPYYLIKNLSVDTNVFQQEKNFLRTLNHPNILPILSSGRSYISGHPFIYKIMPYNTERSLADWFLPQRNTQTLNAADVTPLISQLADVLQSVHNHQMVYQNFKLSNVLLRNPSQETHNLHPFLVDFAFAQNEALSLPAVTALPYIAPERWNNQSLPASDQYGLAAIAYELLTGHPPFQGNSLSIMKYLHMNVQPQPPAIFNSTISVAVSDIILRALQKRPEDRFPSIMAFAKALQHPEKQRWPTQEEE